MAFPRTSPPAPPSVSLVPTAPTYTDSPQALGITGNPTNVLKASSAESTSLLFLRVGIII